MNIGIQQAAQKKIQNNQDDLVISCANSQEFVFMLETLQKVRKISENKYQIHDYIFEIEKNPTGITYVSFNFVEDAFKNNIPLVINDELKYTITENGLYIGLAKIDNTNDNTNILNYNIEYLDVYKHMIFQDLSNYSYFSDLDLRIANTYKRTNRISDYIKNHYYFNNAPKDNYDQQKLSSRLQQITRNVPDDLRRNNELDLSKFITNFSELGDKTKNIKYIDYIDSKSMFYIKKKIYYIPTIEGIQYTFDEDNITIAFNDNKEASQTLNWNKFEKFSMYILNDINNGGYNGDAKQYLNFIFEFAKSIDQNIDVKNPKQGDFCKSNHNPQLIFPETLNATWTSVHNEFKRNPNLHNITLENGMAECILSPLGYSGFFYIDSLVKPAPKQPTIHEFSQTLDLSKANHIINIPTHGHYIHLHIKLVEKTLIFTFSESWTENGKREGTSAVKAVIQTIKNQLEKYYTNEDLNIQFVYNDKPSNHLGDRNNNCLIYSCCLYLLYDILDGVKQNDDIEHKCKEIRDLVENKHKNDVNTFINSEDFNKVALIIIEKQLKHLYSHNKILNAVFDGTKLNDYLDFNESALRAHAAYHTEPYVPYVAYKDKQKTQLMLLCLNKYLNDYISEYNKLSKNMQKLEQSTNININDYINKTYLQQVINDITEFHKPSVELSIHDQVILNIQLKINETKDIKHQTIEKIFQIVKDQLYTNDPSNIEIQADILKNMQKEIGNIQTTGELDTIRSLAFETYFRNAITETSKEQGYVSFDIQSAINDQLEIKSKIKQPKIEEQTLIITPELYVWMHSETPDGPKTNDESDNKKVYISQIKTIPLDKSIIPHKECQDESKCKCKSTCNCKPIEDNSSPAEFKNSTPIVDQHTPTGDLESKTTDNINPETPSLLKKKSSIPTYEIEDSESENNSESSEENNPSKEISKQSIPSDQHSSDSDQESIGDHSSTNDLPFNPQKNLLPPEQNQGSHEPWNQSDNDFKPTSTQKQNNKNSNCFISWIKDNNLLLAIAVVVILIVFLSIDITPKNPKTPKEPNLEHLIEVTA